MTKGELITLLAAIFGSMAASTAFLITRLDKVRHEVLVELGGRIDAIGIRMEARIDHQTNRVDQLVDVVTKHLGDRAGHQ